MEASFDNFTWLRNLALALNREYRYRFERPSDHKSISVLAELDRYTYDRRGLTEFVQAMPEKYKVPGNPVRAYRRFYIGEKMTFAKWTRRGIPGWIRASREGGT